MNYIKTLLKENQREKLLKITDIEDVTGSVVNDSCKPIFYMSLCSHDQKSMDSYFKITKNIWKIINKRTEKKQLLSQWLIVE